MNPNILILNMPLEQYIDRKQNVLHRFLWTYSLLILDFAVWNPLTSSYSHFRESIRAYGWHFLSVSNYKSMNL